MRFIWSVKPDLLWPKAFNVIPILMKRRLRKLRKIRIHREGTNQLLYGGIAFVVIAIILWSCFGTRIPFWCFVSHFRNMLCHYPELLSESGKVPQCRRYGGSCRRTCWWPYCCHWRSWGKWILPWPAASHFHFHEFMERPCELVSSRRQSKIHTPRGRQLS